MSSPPSSSAPMSRAGQASRSKTNSPDRAIAFLVHSPDSVANNLPPDCDNKPLARQRRRRTSPDDQRVLEEAFARNPRPSKEERLEIISKVALGDKEVQIWFQNRRQTSRRKTKPLDTSEIEARLSGSSSAPSSPIQRSADVQDPLQQEKIEGVQAQSEALRGIIGDKKAEEKDEADASEDIRQEEQEQDEIRKADAKEKPEAETQDTTVTTSITSSQGQPQSTLQTELNSSQSCLASSQDGILTSITKPTYLANRRSASFVRQNTEEVPSASQELIRGPKLKKSGSLRLSMTEDGVARVIDRSIPSPPRTQPAPDASPEQQPSIGLRRSYSAAGLNDLFKASATPQNNTNRTKVPRVSAAGRSRDSRAWEFWCDSEARNSLATKAEQENSGSAADAIGLIRQNSKNALRPNSRKGNSPMVGSNSFTSINGKPARQGLQRAKTTMGRLQESSKNGKGGEDALSPSGDSDKENWDPDENVPQNSMPRRRNPLLGNARRGRTILGENANIPSYATSLGGMMESEKKRRAAPANVDAEVAAFMGEEGGTGEDLDCVQSLLSLSKGAWR